MVFMIFPSLCILYLLWREYTRRKVLYEKKVSEEIQTRRGNRENSRIDLGKKYAEFPIYDIWSFIVLYFIVLYSYSFMQKLDFHVTIVGRVAKCFLNPNNDHFISWQNIWKSESCHAKYVSKNSYFRMIVTIWY